jgi:hypothetical protein
MSDTQPPATYRASTDTTLLTYSAARSTVGRMKSPPLAATQARIVLMGRDVHAAEWVWPWRQLQSWIVERAVAILEHCTCAPAPFHTGEEQGIHCSVSCIRVCLGPPPGGAPVEHLKSKGSLVCLHPSPSTKRCLRVGFVRFSRVELTCGFGSFGTQCARWSRDERLLGRPRLSTYAQLPSQSCR